MEEIINGVKTFHAKSRAAWRKWLEKNHEVEKSVWLIIYRKQASVKSVYYPEAVDEALCFGWIDSRANKRDEESYFQLFSQRSAKSNWSAINKKKVASLFEQDLMRPAGMKMVEIAKENGKWSALEEVDQLKIPPDLMKLFAGNKKAFNNWNKFAKSSRKGILEWILNAKREETRRKRIEETVRLAGENIKANFPVKN